MFSRDKWLAPFDVKDGANIIRVRAVSSGAWVDAEVSEGLAYPFYDLSVVDYDSLYQRALSAILAALGYGSISAAADNAFDAQDPGAQRLKIDWSGGAWEIDTDNSSPEILPWLGFAPSQGVVSSTLGGVLVSTHSCYGAWFSYNDLEGRASFKMRLAQSGRAYSSRRLWEAAVVDWGERALRSIRYQRIPAARIVSAYAHDARWARLAGLEQADIYAGFEPIWAALADAQQVLVVHDMEPVGLLGLGAQQLEALTLHDRALETYPDDVARLTGAQGEYFELSLVLRIEHSEYIK